MIHHGDCLDVMAGMEPESVDAIVCDPPYGLGFMGKAWDSPGAFVERKARLASEGFDGVGGNHHPTSAADVARTRLSEGVKAQAWHEAWATAAYRVAKPSAYLLAFGGTRTVHRMTVALEDAGWIIRDMLVWAYASGFPKSKASLKPAWEPIVMARKPGPLRMLAIDACRIPMAEDLGVQPASRAPNRVLGKLDYNADEEWRQDPAGRWPANVLLTATEDGRGIFDGGVEGVVGGGEATTHPGKVRGGAVAIYGSDLERTAWDEGPGDSGTYSRFFLVPKASRSDREPILTPDWFEGTGRVSTHPTIKPTELMRHLVRLVTPSGGVVLDPFGGSGTTALAAEQEGFPWILIEKEAEYVAMAEARLNGTQRGLGLAG